MLLYGLKLYKFKRVFPSKSICSELGAYDISIINKAISLKFNFTYYPMEQISFYNP